VVVTLGELTQTCEQLWPLTGAEAWDAPGLTSGNPDASVTRVHLAVDAVAATVEEAVTLGADVLLTHHPLLLRGVTSIAEDRYKGALLAQLIRGGCALYTAHTNADVVVDGTSGVIAQRLGLCEVRPIVAVAADPSTGLGRVGVLPVVMTLGRLARVIADLLPATATGVRVAGEFEVPVRTVALCAGAGDSLLSDPAVLAADVYVTADMRHHPASEAGEQARCGRGPALIDVSHWASEWLWLGAAAAQVRTKHPDLIVTVSECRTDPWDFQVLQ